MKLLQRGWHFVVSEPFSWLYHYFFKTNTFMNGVEIKDRATRLRLLRRLLLPMFLVSYPLALLLALITSFHFDVFLFIETAAGLLSGILVGILWDAVMNRPVGIPGGMWFGIWLGMWAAISWSAWIAILLVTIGGVALGGGVVKSTGKITTKKFAENKRYFKDFADRYTELEGFKQKYTFWQEAVGIALLYAIGGAAPDLEPKQARSIGSIVIRCIVVSALALVASIAISLIDPWQITWSIWWAITLGSLAGILAGMVLSYAGHPLAGWGAGMGSGIVIGTMLGNFQSPATVTLILAITPAIVTATAWGVTLIVTYRCTVSTSKARKTRWIIFLVGMIPGLLAGYLSGNAWAIILFPLCYIISYCQLPLSVLSFTSLLTAARATRQTDSAYSYPYSYYIQDADDDYDIQDADENSSEVFTQLHASSLYWDEWEILPIPDLEDFNWEVLSSKLENLDWRGLNYMMKLAFAKDIEKATETLSFIETERPLHFEAVRAGMQANDLPLRKLEEENDISEKIRHFTLLQTPVIKLNLSDSYEWLTLVENMLESVAEQDIEQAVNIITLIESEQPPQVATELRSEHDSESGTEDLLYDPLPRNYPRPPRRTGAIRYAPPSPRRRPVIRPRPYPPGQRTPTGGLRPSSPRPARRPAARVRPYTVRDTTYSPLAAARIGLYRGFLKRIAHELEQQITLRDISEAPPQIATLQALATRLNISDLDSLFAHLHDICLDAVHYRNSLGWQARHNALENMITKLRNIKSLENTITKLRSIEEPADTSMQSVIDVLAHWESATQLELAKLQQEPHWTDRINNPYIVGRALQPGTSLFVGRGDLVQQLEQGLGRGGHRPTFFLNGERRMGKSSTLRQLPILLDKRHFLPILFDLQAPEITYNIASFLGSVAERIGEMLESAGMQIAALESRRLQEAQRENERAVYYTFNEWLKDVERVLEQNGRTVLLSFDEFENLELVGKTQSLDLHLLLNWFRSVIQNRPQLALLFSGGKSVSEMGQETGLNWSGYFVNVQTFRVSFLRETEARHLITRPVPDYPIEQIFGTGVVDEIIRVTGCHPFLVQAVCSNLVNNLNADDRERAEAPDVDKAVGQVLEDWEDGYFQDLWTRTNAEQRACLTALNEIGQGDVQQIAQHIDGETEVTRGTLQGIRHTLQVLLRRDLVVRDNESYQIATPIFSQWVERNS